jgi:NTP pyrophosphatase (non-canonical NTP hydrolase)
MISGLNEYQALAMRTNSQIEPSLEVGVTIAALGLAGEAGEFADHVKKHLAQGHALDLDKLDDEAGDVLWYIARYAEASGRSLGYLATRNIQKLAARYPYGFSTERSLNREEKT